MPRQLAAIRQAHPEKNIQVFFQDEELFGQQGTLTRVWAERGSRRQQSGKRNTTVSM
ncbi:MAG: hypothetical protein WD468_02825 [Pirellulales bacterium]